MLAARFIFGAALIASFFVARQEVGPAELRLVSVQDSLGDMFYWYEALVDPASGGGVASLSLSLASSPTASGTNLSAVGHFFDLTAIESPVPLVPFARVGPITPAPWRARLNRSAELTWSGRASSLSTTDSIAPGDTLSGLGLRSTFLPGIRPVEIGPTIQSCCVLPWGTEQTNPEHAVASPREFRVATAATVGPRYTASGMVLDSLDAQVHAACSELHWIADPAVCSEVFALLDRAADELKRGDYEAAGRAVESVRELVVSNRTPQGGVNDYAYWLLTVNAEHLRQEYASRSADPGRK